MPYASLLNQLIENSGLSNKQLCEACEEQGVKLTPAYISLLRNPQEQRTASEAVSRALARALGEENQELLVIQGFLDKAPDCLRALKNYYRDYMSSATAAEIAEGKDEVQHSILMDDYKKLPFAELLAEFTDTVIGNFVLQMKEGGGKTVKSSLDLLSQIDNESSLNIRDAAMAPLIPKGSHALFERLENPEDYRTGDLVSFFRKDVSTIQVRRLAVLSSNRYAMITENPEYETEEFAGSEIVIMGKVKQVVIDF